jgi:hypothetical protein
MFGGTGTPSHWLEAPWLSPRRKGRMQIVSENGTIEDVCKGFGLNGHSSFKMV